MTAFADELDRLVAAKGTKARAKWAKDYLKIEIVHYGVVAPELRRVVRAAVKDREALTREELVATVESLWSRGVFDLQAAAVELLVFRSKLLLEADAALLERLLRTSKTWALVDAIAPFVMGDLVARFPALTATLDRWSTDPDFWVRRAAMLSLLLPLRKGTGDFERFGRYADAMLEETEFFIRKAIGWILRETSKEQPALVFEWLEPRVARTSGVTLREAVKYLTAKQRKQLEAAKQPVKPVKPVKPKVSKRAR